MFDLSHYFKRVFGETDLWEQNMGSVLDIGCGRGYEDALMASWGNKVIGTDIEESSEWKKQENENLKFEKANGEKLPYKDNSFDLVFSKDVLHHTANPKKMLEEAKRVCKKGGKVVFVEANRYNPIAYVHMTKSLGHQHFTQKQFISLVKSVFPNAKLGAFEAHFYPYLPGFALALLAKVEKIISRIRILNPILSYNYFVWKKE